MSAPLVPAMVDLRDFPYMPLDVVRLRDSRLASHASGEGFRCAVLLWCASWHQVPAASLPDDDILLAQYAGFGRAVKEFRKKKAEALHGWVKCTDGRLYHPTVTEKALEAWSQRLQQRYRTECGRIKKAAQRAEIAAVYPTFEEWEAHFIETGSEQWRPANVPAPVPGDKEKCPPNVPGDMASKGREGKGREGIEEQEAQSSLRSDLSPAAPGTDLLGEADPPADLKARKAQRIQQIAEDAQQAYNTILAKPKGLLVACAVLNKPRMKAIEKALPTARAICRQQYGNERVTPEFWRAFFETASEDDFHAGRGPYRAPHENWKPDFEYLLREDVMAKLFERALSTDAAA